MARGWAFGGGTGWAFGNRNLGRESIPAKIRREIEEKYNNKCAICKKKLLV